MEYRIKGDSDVFIFSVRNSAKKMNCSERYLRGQIKLGNIDCVRLGRKVGITPDAIQQYIEKHTVKAFDAKAAALSILED